MCSLCTASLGGRRLAVRKMIECHISAQPRTPFCHYVAFHPQGSVSLDSRVASLPYESSSLATSRGNEKIGSTGYCVTYDTDSQSRNAPCVPFRGRGPRSGEGVDGGKNDYDILIPCLIALKGKRLTTFCASLRSGGNSPIGLKVVDCPTGNDYIVSVTGFAFVPL